MNWVLRITLLSICVTPIPAANQPTRFASPETTELPAYVLIHELCWPTEFKAVQSPRAIFPPAPNRSVYHMRLEPAGVTHHNTFADTYHITCPTPGAVSGNL